MKEKRVALSGSNAYRRSYSRRDFLKLGGAGLAGAALLGTAGCGGSGGDGGNITFTYGATGEEDLRTVRELVDRFNQENENGITVEFQERSEVTDEYFRSLVSDFRAGSASVDVIAGDVIWGAEFAQNGWIEDLSGRMYSDYEPQVPDAFLDAPLSTVSYQNSLWGVPWFTDVGVLYYRRDLLEDAGLGNAPSTWDGLKDIANQVMEQSGTQYGFVFQGGEYEGGVVNGLEYIWNAGGSVLEGNISTSAPGTPVDLSSNFVSIDNPAAIQGLNTERSTISDNISPQEVTEFTETDSNEAFMAGNAVFQRGWPYMYATFGADDSQIKPGSGRSRPAANPGGRPTELELPRRVEYVHERWLPEQRRCLGVHPVHDRPRAAGIPGDGGVVPAHLEQPLRRPGSSEPGTRYRTGERHRQGRRPLAAGYPVLLGYIQQASRWFPFRPDGRKPTRSR